MNKQQLRREANWNAGLILQSIIDAGWSPETLVEKYGEDVTEEIAYAISDLANDLCRRGGES